jgi:hypothetical protein
VRDGRGCDLRDPRPERRARVAASEAEVRHRAKTHHRRPRPLLLVGDHQRASVRTDHLVGLVAEPRFVAELGRCRTAQRAEQGVEKTDVQLPRRRELQEDRAEVVAKRRQALAEDRGQAHAIKPLRGIRQAAGGLHTESESGRRGGSPAQQRLLGRGAIEAAVELHPVETLRVVGEHPRAREVGRVELSFPTRIAEPGRPRVDGAAYVTATLPRITRSCSWPHAASASRPRVSRTVTLRPCASTISLNRRIAARSGAL